MRDDENEGLTHRSEYESIFNDENKSWEDKMSSILDIWQGIKKEAEKYNEENLANATALERILEDEHAKAERAQKKEIAQKATVLKMEMQLTKLKQEGRKAQAKELDERLKQLKKIQELENKIKGKTDALKEAYGDTLEAYKNVNEARKEQHELRNDLIKNGLASGDLGMLKAGLTGGASGWTGIKNALDKMTSTLADLSKKLDKSIEEIASYKSDWDTRLFGTDSSHRSLTSAISEALGASPYVKQSEVLKNIDKAVDTGIAYNIEQRAFLQSIKDDIATTFDAFDGTLLQIIRVQQSDSTASRLGMEAALNEYLNKMFKNTEYLSKVSDTVTGALYEATSLLSSNDSIGFEYQVQKWLGSLYSVGMSQSAVSNIASALGQLASGDVSGTTSQAGRLLVMSASRAGLNYSDLLTKGINDSDINTLMESMVEYLKTIADSNKVVQTELAGVFGLKTSDIQAARNLSTTDINVIAGNGLSYEGGVSALSKMAKTIGSRLSMGEMFGNVLDNFQTTLASSIAQNPVLYGIWSMSNMLDDLVGGIPIPAITALFAGTGVGIDLETTVADLMKVGALGTSLMGSLGSLLSGLSNQLPGQGLAGVLTALGVQNNASSISRGSGLSTGLSEKSTSISGYQGNTSGSDVYDASMAGAEDQKNDLAVSAQDDNDNSDIKLADLNNTVLQIYDLLQSTIIGGRLMVTSKSEFPFN